MKAQFLLSLFTLLLVSCLEGPNQRDDDQYIRNGPPAAPPGSPGAPPAESGIPVSAKEACLLRWPGEFALEAKEFCERHLETDSGVQMDEKLYPKVRSVATEDELIAALVEEVPYKRIVLTKTIILSKKAKFFGPAVIAGPGMLILEDEGVILYGRNIDPSREPACKLNLDGIRTPFTIEYKLRVTADTRNLKFEKDGWSDQNLLYLVLEGQPSGRVGKTYGNIFLVVVNNDIEMVTNLMIDHLVLINSTVKLNLNDSGGARIGESLAISSRIADPFGGRVDNLDCWDNNTVERTDLSESRSQSRQYWRSVNCPRWQQLTQHWAQCGGVK